CPSLTLEREIVMSYATAANRAKPIYAPIPSVTVREAVSPALDDGLSAMQAIGQTARYSRDETIFGDGDDALYSYKVVSGTVRLCKLMSDGRRQIAEFLRAGDF